MKRFCIILLMFVPFSLFADDYSSFAKEAEQNKDRQVQPYLDAANDARKEAVTMAELYKNKIDYKDVKLTSVENIDLNKRKDNSTTIVFISFSMSEKSIVSILQNAKKIHASVVIRGLIHNSFKETFTKMASIVKEAGSGGVELNPPVFKKFNIQKVPAVVVLPYSDTCQIEKICDESKFDVVYGDIPLRDALHSIRDHGDVSRKNAEESILNMEKSDHV